jgi:hypothetical protein
MPNHKFSRREFARRVAMTSAATLVPPSVLATPTLAPTPGQFAPNAPPLPPASQTEADARTQSVLNQYGVRLSDEQKAEIARLSNNQQRQLDILRTYAVQNGDDPALYLKPLMEREKKAASTNPAANSTARPAQATPAPAAAKPKS